MLNDSIQCEDMQIKNSFNSTWSFTLIKDFGKWIIDASKQWQISKKIFYL